MKTEEFVTAQGGQGQLAELVPGRTYVCFFAEQSDDLPARAVARELRVLARSQGVEDRGLVDEVLREAGSGIVGGFAWGAVTASATATLAYLRSRTHRAAPLHDAEQVIACVREAAARILGPQHGELTDTAVVRAADGSWRADFTYGGTRVRTLIDATGSLLQWQQNTVGGGAEGAGSPAGRG